MASKVSCKRTQVRASSKAVRGEGKETLQWSLINFHFCFTQTKQNIIGWKILHRQIILIVDIPGWPATRNFAIHLETQCLRKLGKLWLYCYLWRGTWSISFCDRWTISEDYVAVYFTFQFGFQPRRIFKLENQKAKKGCQENITTVTPKGRICCV